MSKRRFNKEQIDGLLKNKNVGRCSEKSISYALRFKLGPLNDIMRMDYPPARYSKKLDLICI